MSAEARHTPHSSPGWKRETPSTTFASTNINTRPIYNIPSSSVIQQSNIPPIFNSEPRSNTEEASHRPSEAGASIDQSPFCSPESVPANICGQGISPFHSTNPLSPPDPPPSVPQVEVFNSNTRQTTTTMGLSRKSSSTSSPSLAKAQPSNSHLNSLGQPAPTSNGAMKPGHDKIHSTNTSTPSSPAGSISSGADGKEAKFFDHLNGPASPDKSASAATAASKDKLDKNPMSRLGRMFSQSARDKEKQTREKEKETERRKQHPEPSHSGATSPMPRHSEKEGEYSSDTDGGQSRGSSVAGDHPPKSRNVSGLYKNGEATQHFVRFEMLEDGVNHVHHLRAAKRQEKLSTLLQSWLGGKKKDEEVAPLKDQLSLMHSWVDQWKTEKIAAIKKDGSQPSATLVEKYGKCQEIIGKGMSCDTVNLTNNQAPLASYEYPIKPIHRIPLSNNSMLSKNSVVVLKKPIKSTPNVLHPNSVSPRPSRIQMSFTPSTS